MAEAPHPRPAPSRPEARAGGGASPSPTLRLPPEVAHQLDVCVHCGFCLPACPTYRELGEEADSPRGRIDIIAGAARGEVALDDPGLALHLDRCLDCRACESACPSGVRYHELYEAAVAQLPAQRPWAVADRRRHRQGEGAAFLAAVGLVRWGLRWLVGRPRLLAWAVRAAQKLPSPLARHLPAGVAALLPGLPHPPERPARRRLPAVLPAAGPKRGEVALFLGCIQDAVFGEDNVAIARTLAACGYEVHIPRGQTCCGALHLHVGDRAGFARLAAANLAALGAGRPVVVGAAGCSAVLKDYGRLLAATPLAERARAVADRVRDFAEFLTSEPQLPVAMPPSGAPVRVTWHDPCHLCHAQGIRRQPRDLLRSIPGLDYVELPEADACCGSAGVFNLLQPELSAQVLARKVANIAATGARWVVTANPGCALQLRAGLRAAGLNVRVVSLAHLLVEAYARLGA
jgi:glycolate oxidase iron-sulfur subunit